VVSGDGSKEVGERERDRREEIGRRVEGTGGREERERGGGINGEN
jgi:hypothetical protein